MNSQFEKAYAEAVLAVGYALGKLERAADFAGSPKDAGNIRQTVNSIHADMEMLNYYYGEEDDGEVME